jgi:hypothetical protein
VPPEQTAPKTGHFTLSSVSDGQKRFWSIDGREDRICDSISTENLSPSADGSVEDSDSAGVTSDIQRNTVHCQPNISDHQLNN